MECSHVASEFSFFELHTHYFILFFEGFESRLYVLSVIAPSKNKMWMKILDKLIMHSKGDYLYIGLHLFIYLARYLSIYLAS